MSRASRCCYREPPQPANCGRRGAALLVCLFVACITALIIISVLDTLTLHMTALRHTTQYEQASYLAHAGIHHAFSFLEADSNWRAGIPSTEFPTGSGNTYSATVVDGQNGTVVVTGIGVCGDVTRKIAATVSFDWE
jgi:hypothetical protein